MRRHCSKVASLIPRPRASVCGVCMFFLGLEFSTGSQASSLSAHCYFQLFPAIIWWLAHYEPCLGSLDGWAGLNKPPWPWVQQESRMDEKNIKQRHLKILITVISFGFTHRWSFWNSPQSQVEMIKVIMFFHLSLSLPLIRFSELREPWACLQKGKYRKGNWTFLTST